MPCFPQDGENCPDGLVCFTSECCFGLGFCISPDTPTCGGIVGEECPDGLECVIDDCVDDGDGVCVSPDFNGDVCTEQMNCWQGCGG
jgi:hypothetical protein